MYTVTTSDNTHLFVKDWGEGKPIILIHGWPLSSDSWEAQAIALAKNGHRVIAYDRRGFGRSSQPWSGYDYDTLADDLATVIQQTGVQDATLVGFSMGGGEVARYMSRHDGHAITRAALVSSILPFRLLAADNPNGTEQRVFDQSEQHLMADRPKFLAEFFETFFGVNEENEAVSSELLVAMRTIAMQASLHATIECLRSFSTTDFRDDLKAFTVPTLFIHGTADQTVPIEKSSRLAARQVEYCTLIEYDGAPHGLFVTEQARLTKDLLSFMYW